MIRLFKKVRQKLLSENSYSLYILYASGEILLVIVGIIIALQIDNWNENRKESNIELQLYSDLLEDLGNENFAIEAQIDRVNQYDELNFHVYNETNGEAQYDPKLYYNLLISYHRYNMFITDKYHEYLSSMTNDRIHQYMKSYIRQENNTKNAVEEWNEHQLQHVRPYFSRYGINNTEAMFNEQLTEFAAIVDYTEIIDYSKLKEQYGSEEFDQLLFTIRFDLLWMAQNLIWLRDNNRRFQIIISKELALTKLKGTYDQIDPETIEEFILIGTNSDDIIEILRQEVENKVVYDFSETEVNAYGYDLMRDEKYEDALTVFKLNTELYPDSWNTYDSYGECLLETGDTVNGIKAYEKSLELNPNNSNAIKVLKEFKNK